MRILPYVLAATLPLAWAPRERLDAAGSCEALASLALPQTRITRAQLVPAGQFAATPAGILAPGAPSFLPYKALATFCRVTATLTPSSDSDIAMELWMPAEGWNGKFEALGNGGWAGQISVQGLAGGLSRGYAVATTDTGHSTPGAIFAFNHPEKLTDFAYRAVHEMTVRAKAIVGAYYSAAPKTSYWNGCSTGGRQGLKEAQRYPDDYDAIIAGAPASYMTHLEVQAIWVARAVRKQPGSFIPREKYAALHQAALDACDDLDGVKDGVLDDPTRCHFDPKVIECRGDDGPTCLTAAQVQAARDIYAPATNPRTKAEIYPGQSMGSEMSWTTGLAGATPLPIATDYFKYIVFKNPDWDFMTFDFDKDVARADALDHGDMNAMDPDLTAFVARGGKLLMYHGWNDQLIAPLNTVNYYTSVAKKLGGAEKIAGAIRLFMMPGVTHCVGGDGPSNFDALGTLERWVEQKQPPDQIVASHLTTGVVDRTRPLCPYPQTAVYRGTGDTNKAENFTCRVR